MRGRLQAEVGDVEYRTWLRQMTLAGVDGDEVTVRLPTRFLRDWVRSHYGDKPATLWRAEDSRIRRVDLRVGGAVAPAEGLAETIARRPPGAGLPPVPPSRADDASTAPDGDAALDPRFSFESFVVGKPNEFAYACARRVADQPASPASTRCSCMAAWAWARRT